MILFMRLIKTQHQELTNETPVLKKKEWSQKWDQWRLLFQKETSKKMIISRRSNKNIKDKIATLQMNKKA